MAKMCQTFFSLGSVGEKTANSRESSGSFIRPLRPKFIKTRDTYLVNSSVLSDENEQKLRKSVRRQAEVSQCHQEKHRPAAKAVNRIYNSQCPVGFSSF